MVARQMPATAGARKFKKLAGGIGIAAIVSITLAVNSLVSHLANVAVEPSRREWISVGVNSTQIIGGAAVLWVVYRARRHNLAPPVWALAAVVLLSWAAILLPRV